MPILLLLWGGAQKAFFAILEFCSKPPGSWIAAALGLVLCGWVIHHHGVKQGRGACEAEHAEAAANELARQKSAIEAVTSRASVRATKSEAVNTKNKVIVRVIHDQAAAMPDASDVCIPAELADGLRSIH
jgi:hypothetical protein